MPTPIEATQDAWRCDRCRKSEAEHEQGKVACHAVGCRRAYCFACARIRKLPSIWVCSTCTGPAGPWERLPYFGDEEATVCTSVIRG